MFTFMFSVVQSLDHFIQTSAFSSLAASLTEGRARSCQGMNSLPGLGFPWARGRISAGVSHHCLTLFLWSKVEMGNGFICSLCLSWCPVLGSVMSHPFWVLSRWELFQKREKLLGTMEMAMNSVGVNEHLVCTFCNIEYCFDLVKTRWILGYLGEYPESFWDFSFTWICSNCFITVLKLLTGFLSEYSVIW